MEVAGFISVGMLVVIQIAYFAYTFGKIDGRVQSIDKRFNDLSHRLDRIEERIHNLEVKSG